uniref:DM2 domain-containing protein n=1 Tax=Oryza barthii TaxID=65489 RepID=A0A0D3FPD6_9ORYZ
MASASMLSAASLSLSPSPLAALRPPRPAASFALPRRAAAAAVAAVVGAAEIPRTEALKRLWAYIKQHNLQDPADKKVIVCDEKLKVLFAGQERVGFLEVAKLLNPHFVK